MKRKLICLFVAVVMTVLLLPTAFAGSGVTVTNGTPEIAKETNHGYITIDKGTAEESDAVTVEAHPAEGYQLKTLTATPVAPTISTIADVLATVEEFPEGKQEKSSSPEPIGEAWSCGGCCAFEMNNLALLLKASDSYIYAQLTTGVMFDATNKCYTATVSTFGTLKFNMTDGVLTSFTYTHNEGKSEAYDGTYAPASTPSPRLKPITPAKQTDGTYQFTMPGYAVIVTAEFEKVPAHTHSFTYTANNGKLTTTCTQGCDKGYDTTPLTLTLTAPAGLVYDGNAKAFTFAAGEADAWTGAGLELPTIYYYEKKDYPFYMGIDSAPTDAGGDYMVEITVNKKAAQIYFTIDKATPYIKTNPEPTDIVYGKKLSDSTLAGGYVQVTSANTTQVGGLFEWKLGDTVPALSDSETTEYDVTFTPADTDNYNTVFCKVTIKVIHIHNLIKVTGQVATETAAGWGDYYECKDSNDACHEYFEDATGLIPIENLDAWKSSTGNGYLAATGEPSNPQTGDSTNLVLWITIAAASALGAVICIKKRR